MTASEIRRNMRGPDKVLTGDDCRNYVLTEAAAQLAELNENLVRLEATLRKGLVELCTALSAHGGPRG